MPPKVLGRIGPDAKSAIPALAELLNDKDQKVRKVAAVSLWKIKQEK